MLLSVFRRLERLHVSGLAVQARALSAHAPEQVVAAAKSPVTDVLERLFATPAGLSSAEAIRRLDEHGPNTVADSSSWSPARLVARAVLNPLVMLLGVLAISALLTGDPAAAAIMLVMLAIGVGLRLIQESHASAAAADLQTMIRVHSTALRDGQPVEVPIAELVPGDIVHLAAGDMVPADLRLLSSKDLFVSQATLTGESFPVEKIAADVAPGGPPLELATVCWLGTSVESGTAEAVVVATGRRTLLGGVSRSLEEPEPPSAFDIGMARFTWLMVALVAVMVPLVLLANGLTKGDWSAALLFALAVAVGLTPEMLPMIVAVCLARGAIGMARKRVIVKHLDSIQNLGAMDILCADKTGTLTLDRIILERHCDVMLREDDEVLALAWLNSHFQTGLRNLMDRAILEHEECRDHAAARGWTKIDEIPFDFARRVMSVVVEGPGGGRRLVCKGAPEAVYSRCTAFELDGTRHPMNHEVPRSLAAEFAALSADGFRVLAIGYRELAAGPPGEPPAYSRDDERDLVLRGYVAFLDPPKDSAAAAVAALAAGGVAVKVLTGDNELVSRKICGAVGIPTKEVLVGTDVDGMDETALAAAAVRATVMARLSPAQKRRIVEALRRAGHVVGFMGDGINDAAALRAADVGISVESAVDIARVSADCILLDKDLRVLEAGILEGRRVFVNILKYVRMGASSNFGNMVSVLGASLFLPFVPMTPLQLLTNNLLYDCSQVPIPTDNVDPELIARPRPWSMGQISRFILLVGPCSSIFDYTTFAVMMFVFGCTTPDQAALFQTGWFVESLLTQTFIIHVIRTERIPFLESRASPALTATTFAVAFTGIWLATGPLGRQFGFVPLPPAYWVFLAITILAYALVTQGVKRWLVRHGWID